MSASAGSGFFSRRCTAARIIPGVQMPHCAPPHWRNASWRGFIRLCADIPSMVTTLTPFACATGMRQLFTNMPSSRTQHEPHSPSPHPSFVPVNPKSFRSTSNNLSIGCARTFFASPLTAKCEVSFTVNGEAKKVLAHPMERLLDVLRNDLGLTGTKEGCGEGECGSCCVLLAGMLVNSCLIPVAQANGVSVVTIEGMSAHNLMKPLQEAFLQCGGAQCGICTPGMILAAVHLLEKKPEPALADIQEGLAGNLCRCTGYMQIFEAIAHAARQRAAQ